MIAAFGRPWRHVTRADYCRLWKRYRRAAGEDIASVVHGVDSLAMGLGHGVPTVGVRHFMRAYVRC
jgi:hypothetical protein